MSVQLLPPVFILLMTRGILSSTILFQDDFSSLDQFTTSDHNVEIGIFMGCPFSLNSTENLYCARLSNSSFMWTHSGLINTVGYTNITLSVDVSFRNWSDSLIDREADGFPDQWGTFSIRGSQYPNYHELFVPYQFLAEFDQWSFQGSINGTPALDGYTMNYSLDSWAENSTTMVFEFALVTYGDCLVFIDNMQINGTRLPTTEPSSYTTYFPTRLPSESPTLSTKNPSITPSGEPSDDPTKMPSDSPTSTTNEPSGITPMPSSVPTGSPTGMLTTEMTLGTRTTSVTQETAISNEFSEDTIETVQWLLLIAVIVMMFIIVILVMYILMRRKIVHARNEVQAPEVIGNDNVDEQDVPSPREVNIDGNNVPKISDVNGISNKFAEGVEFAEGMETAAARRDTKMDGDV